MGLIWDLIQHGQISEAKDDTASLERRVEWLERELTRTNETLFERCPSHPRVQASPARGSSALEMRFASLVALLVLLGCGAPGSDGEDVMRRDSSAIQIVENRGGDRLLDWRASTVLSLGGAESGPESFFQLTRGLVDVDGEGNIHIIDMSNHRVVVFDSSGSFQRQMGQAGQGPGEFTFPINIAVSPDGSRTRVFDAAAGRFSDFDAGGALAGVEELREGIFGGMRYAESGVILRLSDLVLPTDRYDRLLHVAGPDTTVLVREALPEGRMVFFASCNLGLPGAGPVFARPFSWAVRGEQIAVRSGSHYEIKILTGGETTSIVRRAIEAVPATVALAVRSEAGSGLATLQDPPCDPEEMVRERGVAEFLPLVLDLAIDPDRWLWVRRRVDFDLETIDVVDASGRYVGTLPQAFPWPIGFMPDGRALVISKDEWDVESLQVIRIERQE